jgi:hypothetical protein
MKDRCKVQGTRGKKSKMKDGCKVQGGGDKGEETDFASLKGVPTGVKLGRIVGHFVSTSERRTLTGGTFLDLLLKADRCQLLSKGGI